MRVRFEGGEGAVTFVFAGDEIEALQSIEA